MNGIELKTHRQTHVATAICFLTKEPKLCFGEKIASLTNGAGKIGYSFAVFHLVQISIQSGSKALM
jgi:hypothetical protein